MGAKVARATRSWQAVEEFRILNVELLCSELIRAQPNVDQNVAVSLATKKLCELSNGMIYVKKASVARSCSQKCQITADKPPSPISLSRSSDLVRPHSLALAKRPLLIRMQIHKSFEIRRRREMSEREGLHDGAQTRMTVRPSFSG